ncbi:hypothetical protein L208DRAFT_1068099, partial [Tricholoma matsutake]
SMSDDNSAYELNLCSSCLSAIDKHKLPPLALANQLFLGPVPPELQDLTPIKESMIALYPNLSFPQNQCGFHGNIIIYPQSAQKIAMMLPPSIEEITLPICIIFVG